MVGARKLVFNINEIENPLKELLEKCNVVQLYAEGSESHAKAGLAPNKVLVKAYKQNRKEKPFGGLF